MISRALGTLYALWNERLKFYVFSAYRLETQTPEKCENVYQARRIPINFENQLKALTDVNDARNVQVHDK